MKKSDYQPGMKLKFRTVEDLTESFGINTYGHVTCGPTADDPYFTKHMFPLGGTDLVFESPFHEQGFYPLLEQNGEAVYEWKSPTYHGTTRWHITFAMLEPATPIIKDHFGFELE